MYTWVVKGSNDCMFACLMVFNAIFNTYFSYIVPVSLLVVNDCMRIRFCKDLTRLDVSVLNFSKQLC